MLQLISKLDLFPKAAEEYRVKTVSGAIVSIISVLLMAFLFFSELSYYFKTVRCCVHKENGAVFFVARAFNVL